MCFSKTVWASLGDSSTSCKETISIASHCFYSWFLASSLSHCSINCTEVKASLPITRSQNNNTHHHSHFLLFWRQSVHEKEHSALYSAIVFFPTSWRTGGDLEEIWPCCTQWEFASSLTGAIISLNVSILEPSPMNRYTRTDPYPCRKCHWMTHRNCILWTGYFKAHRWKRQSGFPQAVIHPDTGSDSIKGLYDVLALE